MSVPAARIRIENDRPVVPDGDYVLYWMTSARRLRYNFALQRAVEHCLALGTPLVILEAIRADYPFACDRFHAFVIDGMRDNQAAARAATYRAYVEPEPRAGRGLLQALASRAAVVVTDWFPAFFLPAQLRRAAAQCGVRMESVDGNGLIPVGDHGRHFPTARGYRAFVQRHLRDHLAGFPLEAPLDALRASPVTLPADIDRRWPQPDLRRTSAQLVASLPIDHAVAPTAVGGMRRAHRTLRAFVEAKLPRYGDEGNDPDADVTSRLSPYLHFGHISAHEVFSAIMTRERWTTRKIGKTRAGAREGWWGTSPAAEHFLDQLVVWRELAFNLCALVPGYERYDTLPAWARATLEAHLEDPRPHRYSLEELDAAATADEVWNAAQRELKQDGWFHGYMRMLWGKKILEWTEDPADALLRMEGLMNRYSLDGRDPVSYLNFGWVLGRLDRPWPERAVFGTVRTMTSESAKRKLKMKRYLARYGVSAS